jgi:putative tryptophan/tyrosine transport system substrate-binding protein
MLDNQRREFIILAGAAGLLLAAKVNRARGQQPGMPVIGFLGSSSAQVSVKDLEAFRKGLSETGYLEGRNVAIEFRWTGGREDRMPELAADLVRRQVAVIAAPASTAGALAAKAATSSIPIVFGTGSDPVALGLVASLNRPGGNATGVMSLNVELTAKRLGLLRELAPQATRFVALVNSNAVMSDAIAKDVHALVARRVIDDVGPPRHDKAPRIIERRMENGFSKKVAYHAHAMALPKPRCPPLKNPRAPNDQ